MKVKLLRLSVVASQRSYMRVSQRFESIYTLHGNNMTIRRTHCLEDLTYNDGLKSPSRGQIILGYLILDPPTTKE
jgi:hypothetical protein